MFESLSDKLKKTLKNLRGQGKLTPEHVDAALREIRMALLEADVNYKVAKDFVESVRAKAEGQEVWQGLNPHEQPRMNQVNRTVLEPDTVICIEYSYYHDGVRHHTEDTFLLKADGVEHWTADCPRELVVPV